jgi:hypothetical protein
MTNPKDTIIQEYYIDSHQVERCGLTKLELFSAMAMQGLISNSSEPFYLDAKTTSEFALTHAKALITELNKEQ